MSQENGSYR